MNPNPGMSPDELQAVSGRRWAAAWTSTRQAVGSQRLAIFRSSALTLERREVRRYESWSGTTDFLILTSDFPRRRHSKPEMREVSRPAPLPSITCLLPRIA